MSSRKESELTSDDDFDLDDDDDYDYDEKVIEDENGTEEEEERTLVEIKEESTAEVERAEAVLSKYNAIICDEEAARAAKLDLLPQPIVAEPWDPYEEVYEDEKLLDEEFRLFVFPFVDPARTQLAYGWAALPKLNRELHGITTTKQRALIQLCDYLYDPEHISRAKREGIIDTLRGLLGDRDKIVRVKAGQCLTIIAGHPSGVYALLAANILPNLNKMLDDDSLAARRNAQVSLRIISSIYQGSRAILVNKMIPKLMDKLKKERNFIQAIILDTLHNCFQDDVRQALEANGMLVFKELLNHKYPIIRAKVARAILDLSIQLQGKKDACSVNVVTPLIKLLADAHPLVQAKATAALMMITITTKGKTMALDGKIIDEVRPLLAHEKFEVRQNALKVLTNVAEATTGRTQLLLHTDEISPLLDDPHPSVILAAEIALRVIQWKHACVYS